MIRNRTLKNQKMKTEKLKIVGIVILLVLLQFASAQETCNGTMKLLEIQPVPILAGENAMIVISLENITIENIRNLDLFIFDPPGNSISSEQFRISNTTNTISRKLTITREFLSGNYSVSARLKILNSTNIEQEICTISADTPLQVETERRSYSDVSIEIEMLNATRTWDSNTSRNISINGVVLPINLYMRNLPVSANVVISDINFSNEVPEITISPDVPYYPLDFVQRLQDRCVFSENFSDELQLLYKRCGTTAEYLANDSMAWKYELDRTVNEFELLKNSTAGLEQYNQNLTIQLEEAKKFNFLSANFLIGFFMGGIGIIVILYRIAVTGGDKRKG